MLPLTMLGSARRRPRSPYHPLDSLTMPNAVILANGTPPSRATLKDALRRATLFVCADGGSDVARRYGEIPHAIVGDLDSISEESLSVFGEIPIIPNPDTERTDTEKAVEWVLTQ